MAEEITFSCGRSGVVHTVPTLMLQDLTRLPRYEITAEDDADAMAQKATALEEDTEALALLFAFSDWDVPRGWKYPEAARAKGLCPQPDDDGLKLAYIRYGLLVTPLDNIKAQRAMFAGLTEEEVEAAASTFRPARRAPWWRRILRR